ncbi:uncharacterized protein LOC108862184 [Raphanus sativus]|uniref:Uncharacterized protein LOC108862184 n=1 Tax=Raphanus sativus TaxID=3726 RepID=A0A6J0P506_RAPSA|nr:uncharacterized protein LOC108862184 [Raphanus sativus]
MNPNLILCTHHQFHPPFRFRLQSLLFLQLQILITALKFHQSSHWIPPRPLLWREAFCSSPSDHLFLCSERVPIRSRRFQVSAASSANGAPPKSFYYNLIIIGAGVGGHGAVYTPLKRDLKLPSLKEMLLERLALTEAVCAFQSSLALIFAVLTKCFRPIPILRKKVNSWDLPTASL